MEHTARLPLVFTITLYWITYQESKHPFGSSLLYRLSTLLDYKEAKTIKSMRNGLLSLRRSDYAYRNQDKIRLCRSADAPTCQAGD
jgi:hypothetical protein